MLSEAGEEPAERIRETVAWYHTGLGMVPVSASQTKSLPFHRAVSGTLRKAWPQEPGMTSHRLSLAPDPPTTS